MAGKVFVFGSINTDLVVYVARLPHPGETVAGGTYASYPGGKGANQAVAAARAGAAVQMFGCLGDDLFGRERIASLEETGVSTRGVRVVRGAASGIAQITVDAEGENTIAVAPGANMLFSAKGIALPWSPRGAPCVSLFQNEVPQEATEELIGTAHAAGHIVLWNIAPTLARRPSEAVLGAVDFLLVNRNELSALTGRPVRSDGQAESEEETIAEARLSLDWGVRNLVVTLGRRGSIWISAQNVVRVDAFPVDAVDTVGAGDCYCGVFAASLAEGKAPREALRRASAAAAISATRKGAQPSMPGSEEIAELLRSRGG
jgi:ribokinase